MTDPLTPEDLANVNKSAMRRLVAALRSGNYPQGKRNLMQVDATGAVAYCCLGVACVLAKEWAIPIDITVTLSSSHPGTVMGMFVRDETGEATGSLLTGRIARFYGFTTENPVLRVLQTDAESIQFDHYTSATIANDELGMDFNAIADAFERTYLPDEASSD